MLTASQLLQHAVEAVLACESALSNTTAVASLASAMTSLTKRAVQFTIAAQAQDSAADAAAAAAEADAGGATAAANFPAVVPSLASLGVARTVPAAASLVRRSSSSSNQAATSTAFLAVLHARSLLQLADAMQAAGPQLLFKSLTSGAKFKLSGALKQVKQRFGGITLGPRGVSSSRLWKGNGGFGS
jgi:hypothetical protein